MKDHAEKAPQGNEPLLADWMTRAELAADLHVSIDTLARWETRRIGPPLVRVGRRVLYRREGVRDWLRKQERGA